MPQLANNHTGKHRSVLITGAGKRLGRAIAIQLAAEGWRVAVHYRLSKEEAIQTAQECNALTSGAEIFQTDLENEHEVRSLLPKIIQSFGTLDAIVNSASTFEFDNASSFTYSSMEKHWRCNTGAAIILSQALFEHTTKKVNNEANQNAGKAVVVNLLDQKLWNQNPDFFSYTLSKAALEAANTMLALELSPLVRVVGVAPGLTLTSHMLSDEKFALLHKLSPLGKSSSVEDVVNTVAFALDNQSITGTTLLVDGGQHLIRFARDFSLM